MQDFCDRSKTVRMCTATTFAEQFTCCGFEFPEHDCTIDRCKLAATRSLDENWDCRNCWNNDSYCAHRFNGDECDNDDI